MNLTPLYFSVFCSQLCSPLVLMQLLGMPDHCLLTDLDRICWLLNPEGWMKCRNFIWGRVRRREKIIHKIHTTPNTLYIFTAQLRDCNSFPTSLCNSSPRPRTLRTGAERGILVSALSHSWRNKWGLFNLVKGWEGGKKALLKSGDFLPQSTNVKSGCKEGCAWSLQCAEAGGRPSLCYHECPDTESRQQTTSKPLQILEKWPKPSQKQLVKMEETKYQRTWPMSMWGCQQPKRTTRHRSATSGRDGDHVGFHWGNCAVKVLLQTQPGYKPSE